MIQHKDATNTKEESATERTEIFEKMKPQIYADKRGFSQIEKEINRDGRIYRDKISE